MTYSGLSGYWNPKIIDVVLHSSAFRRIGSYLRHLHTYLGTVGTLLTNLPTVPIVRRYLGRWCLPEVLKTLPPGETSLPLPCSPCLPSPYYLRHLSGVPGISYYYLVLGRYIQGLSFWDYIANHSWRASTS